MSAILSAVLQCRSAPFGTCSGSFVESSDGCVTEPLALCSQFTGLLVNATLQAKRGQWASLVCQRAESVWSCGPSAASRSAVSP